MRLRIPAPALAAVITGLLTVSCSNPPDKEMQQAQDALDAARAGGADQYAAEEYTAAVLALDKSREAVNQRDYRLALSQALDSRERAQTAARLATEQKAAVRTEDERLLAEVGTELDACTAKLKAAQAVRLPAKTLAPLQREIPAATSAMQKARAALDRHDYLAAQAALKGVFDRLAKARGEVESATGERQSRPNRRRD